MKFSTYVLYLKSYSDNSLRENRRTESHILWKGVDEFMREHPHFLTDFSKIRSRLSLYIMSLSSSQFTINGYSGSHTSQTGVKKIWAVSSKSFARFGKQFVTANVRKNLVNDSKFLRRSSRILLRAVNTFPSLPSTFVGWVTQSV